MRYRDLSKYRRLTGNLLKGIALTAMTVDHTAAVLIKGYVSARARGLSGGQLACLNVLYVWMRHVGRIAFPLFAFLMTEGFFHTRDRRRYGLRLFACALLSEIPYDLACGNALWDWGRQNTVFTLCLGFLTLQGTEWIAKLCCRIKGAPGRRAIAGGGGGGCLPFLLCIALTAATGVLAWLCRLDYGWQGIALIAVFSLFYQYRGAAALAGFCVFSSSPFSLPAFLLLPFYNGERGRYRLRWLYAFYPAHLLALYGLLRLALWAFA